MRYRGATRAAGVRFARAVGVRLARCRDRLSQWRWIVIVAPVMAGVLSTGCMAIEMAYLHSTSFVAPVGRSPSRSPAAGPLVAVKVEDHRAGVAGYEVGAKYNPGWGGYEGSTIDLKDKASLADQVAQDAVGVLREQGYRAEVIREIPEGAADILLTVDIDVFTMSLTLGQDVRLDGLFFLEAVRPSDSRRWTDAVGARFELASSIYPSDAEFQGCFERLYSTLRDKMRDRLRVGLRL